MPHPRKWGPFKGVINHHHPLDPHDLHWLRPQIKIEKSGARLRWRCHLVWRHHTWTPCTLFDVALFLRVFSKRIWNLCDIVFKCVYCFFIYIYILIYINPRHPNASWEGIWIPKIYLIHFLWRYLDVYQYICCNHSYFQQRSHHIHLVYWGTFVCVFVMLLPLYVDVDICFQICMFKTFNLRQCSY